MPADRPRVEDLVGQLRSLDREGSVIGARRLYPDLALARRIAGLGQDALPSLHAAVCGDDEYRAEDAAFCLGLIAATESVRPLADAGAAASDPRVRIAICRALGNIGSPAAVPFLEGLLTDAPPQIDLIGGEYMKHHSVRWAAAEALRRITGEERHFTGEEAFAPPAETQRRSFVCKAGALNGWEIEGGEWRETKEGIEGAATDSGRLWLAATLPAEYVLSAGVQVRGGVAGVSYGHLKDYPVVTRMPDYPGTWLEWTVSESRMMGRDVCGGVLSQCSIEATWRSCAVGSRADIGNRIALFVSGGKAVFSGVEVTEGPPPYAQDQPE